MKQAPLVSLEQVMEGMVRLYDWGYDAYPQSYKRL